MALNPPPLQSGLRISEGAALWSQAWSNWMTRAWQILSAAEQSGVTANRPTSYLWIGRPYFDTTLGRPIFWNGTAWIRADGTVV